MGTFAILASMFIQPLLTAFNPANAIESPSAVGSCVIIIYLVETLVAATGICLMLLTAAYINSAGEYTKVPQNSRHKLGLCAHARLA